MGSGILQRGFQINNHKICVKVPKNTLVSMGYSNGVYIGYRGCLRFNGAPTVWFRGFDIKLMRVNGRWFADVYGVLVAMEFPKGGLPWPLSYFKA